jgi:hypothetical protein
MTANHKRYAAINAIAYPNILLLTILVMVLLVAKTLKIRSEVLTGIPYLVRTRRPRGAIACQIVNVSGRGIHLVISLPREISHPFTTQL